jgi:hypothetical protein
MISRPWIAFLFVAVPIRVAIAQTDYRNLDAGRPLVTEDAYPTAHYAFEFTAPFRMERGVHEHRVELAPQLSYGLLRNTMVSIEVPWTARTDLGRTFKARTPQFSVLSNFNTEFGAWPALAVRGSADRHASTVTLIATRSFGRVRAHLNVGGSSTSERDVSSQSPVNRWAASLASDVTLWRSSLLLAGEVQVARPIGGVRPWRVGAGARWQFTPTLVLDLGAYRTHSAQAGQELGLTFGITQLFGIAFLMPKGGK